MLKNISLFVTSLLISIIAAEIILKFFEFNQIEFIEDKIVKLDGYNKEGHSSYDYKWVKQTTHEFIKSPQVNFKKLKLKASDNTKRILLVGDSATAGFGVSTYETFASKLQRQLGSKFQVINAGIPGFDNKNEINALKEKLIHLKPNIVVWQIFMANDLNYNPFFKRNERISYKNSSSILDRSALYKATLLAFKSIGINIYKKFNLHITKEIGLTQNEYIDENNLNYIDYSEGQYALFLKKRTDIHKLIFEEFEKISLEFKDFSKDKSFKLFVIIVPTRSAIKDDLDLAPDLENAKKHFGKTNKYYQENLDFHISRNKVTEILKRNDIEFYDPVEEIKKGMKLEFFVQSTNDHPSNLGHSLYANKIHEYIEKGND